MLYSMVAHKSYLSGWFWLLLQNFGNMVGTYECHLPLRDYRFLWWFYLEMLGTPKPYNAIMNLV